MNLNFVLLLTSAITNYKYSELILLPVYTSGEKNVLICECMQSMTCHDMAVELHFSASCMGTQVTCNIGLVHGQIGCQLATNHPSGSSFI